MTGFAVDAGSAGCPFCPAGCVCDVSCACIAMTTMMNSQALSWDPPFDKRGAPGWKSSTKPLCAWLDTVVGLDVWSDADGVFALVSGQGISSSSRGQQLEDDAGVDVAADAATPAGTSAFGSTARTVLWHNDGGGWKLKLDEPDIAGAFALAGTPRSSLLINDPSTGVQAMQVQPGGVVTGPLITSTGGSPKPCALGVVSGASLECFDLDPVQSVFAVRDRLAYGVMGNTRLLSYDGTWHSSTLIPYPVEALWADDHDVLAVGKAGTVLWLENGSWSVEDTGSLAHFTAAWATGRNDVWLGTGDGDVMHFDGQRWTALGHLGGLSCTATTPVRGIWGAGDSVFFYSDAQVARWDGTRFESLGNWSCGVQAGTRALQVTGLWGNGPREVFVSLIDFTRAGVDSCGPAFVVYFDGSSFHRL
jgi:hypothetical protein